MQTIKFFIKTVICGGIGYLLLIPHVVFATSPGCIKIDPPVVITEIDCSSGCEALTVNLVEGNDDNKTMVFVDNTACDDTKIHTLEATYFREDPDYSDDISGIIFYTLLNIFIDGEENDGFFPVAKFSDLYKHDYRLRHENAEWIIHFEPTVLNDGESEKILSFTLECVSDCSTFMIKSSIYKDDIGLYGDGDYVDEVKYDGRVFIECKLINLEIFPGCNQNFYINSSGKIGDKEFGWDHYFTSNYDEYRQIFTLDALKEQSGVISTTINGSDLLIKTNYASDKEQEIENKNEEESQEFFYSWFLIVLGVIVIALIIHKRKNIPHK